MDIFYRWGQGILSVYKIPWSKYKYKKFYFVNETVELYLKSKECRTIFTDIK